MGSVVTIPAMITTNARASGAQLIIRGTGFVTGKGTDAERETLMMRKTYTAASRPPVTITAATAHRPLPTAAFNSSHFAIKPPLGGNPIRLTPARAKAKISFGSRRPIPSQRSSRSLPTACINDPATMNAAAFAQA
jgi:hypothetical protein